MAELDFSKIFGETATSKASFTDENYLNGWGYLGSTPPPYQLFDYLQSLNDKKTKYLYDKTIENDNKIKLHNTDATAHADIRAKITSDINSHNTNATAHTEILNAIKAISGMSAYDIAPSKTIATMIPLLGFGGIVAQKLEDNGYIKFANGLTFQWGKLTNSAGTFPISFSTTVFLAVATSDTVNSPWNRPVIPMKPVTTLTGVSFTGYISIQEQANTWTTSSFSGKYFCIGI